jgi:hypothetical protein
MLDDEMDHIIREAAENHHPPYNDKAWEKMELQLDKHLPQKTDRRKLIFFLLFFLLLGGAFFLMVNRFTGSEDGNKNIVSEKEPGIKGRDKNESGSLMQKTGTDKNQDQVNETNQVHAADQISGSGDNKSKTSQDDKSKTSIALYDLPEQRNDNNSEDLNNRNRKFTSVSSKATKVNFTNAKPYEESLAEDQVKAGKKIRNNKTAGKVNIAITGAAAEINETETAVSQPADTKNPEEGKKEIVAKTESEKESVKVNKEEKEKDLTLTKEKPVSTPDKKKAKKNVAGNFGLTFSVGPDLSFINLNKPGKVTLLYGAGISYDVAKRFTVRTGLFFSKKIYVADPDQYHAVIYPHLTSIDADCKILEIPISVSYRFGQKNKHNWFGNAGLSSFIMKSEGYNYNYKSSYGQTYSYYREISNENKHYFSVLTLSGGYNYHLSKRVSIQAEPYLKLPLSGIGLGKIKLNSSGVLFTVTVKPFAKGK